eukprot:TRINITY_DN1607_c0_g1_i13.p1 TRINITY_DN1607_c0_g1~~TRINITY_DN1607_c0_g1_i13.p1  ORF type:complete len:436 (-),score=51.40 TRINITY_DN1607_c0_g1_i13:422-1729(-)
MTKNLQKALSVLLAFITMYMFAMVLPPLPNSLAELHEPATSYGFVLMSFTVGQVMTSLVVGLVYSKFGWKRILLVSCLCLCISGNILTALSPNYWVLLFARFLAGMGTGFQSIVAANVKFIYAAELGVHTGFTIQQVSKGLGYFAGPGTAALVNATAPDDAAIPDCLPLDMTIPCLSITVLCVVAIVMAITPANCDDPPAAAMSGSSLWPKESCCRMVTLRACVLLYSVFACSLSFVAVESAFVPMMQTSFGWSARLTGLTLPLLGLSVCLTPVIPRIIGNARLDVRWWIVIGQLSMMASLCVWLIPWHGTHDGARGSAAEIIAVCILFGASYGLTVVTSQTLLTTTASSRYQGYYQTMYSVALGVGRLIAPLIVSAGMTTGLELLPLYVALGLITSAAVLFAVSFRYIVLVVSAEEKGLLGKAVEVQGQHKQQV